MKKLEDKSEWKNTETGYVKHLYRSYTSGLPSFLKIQEPYVSEHYWEFYYVAKSSVIKLAFT